VSLCVCTSTLVTRAAVSMMALRLSAVVLHDKFP